MRLYSLHGSVIYRALSFPFQYLPPLFSSDHFLIGFCVHFRRQSNSPSLNSSCLEELGSPQSAARFTSRCYPSPTRITMWQNSLNPAVALRSLVESSDSHIVSPFSETRKHGKARVSRGFSLLSRIGNRNSRHRRESAEKAIEHMNGSKVEVSLVR